MKKHHALCDRCGKPGAEHDSELWLDLHPRCAEEWWEQVARERAAGLTVRPQTPPNDDDPALLRQRGVF